MDITDLSVKCQNQVIFDKLCEVLELLDCGDSENVTGNICFQGFDFDNGLLEAGQFSQMEIKIDGVSVAGPLVIDYTVTYDGTNKSTWYTPWLNAINALPEWSITVTQDNDGTPGNGNNGKPTFDLAYSGTGSKELKLCKGPAGTTSPEELVFTVDATGDITGQAFTYGGTEPIPSPVFC